MPEFAEVEFFRKRWQQAAAGQRITRAELHPAAKIFRGAKSNVIRRALTGARFLSSAAQAKQMLFRFSGGSWLGIHLGMSGELTVGPADYAPGKHDHFVLKTAERSL